MTNQETAILKALEDAARPQDGNPADSGLTQFGSTVSVMGKSLAPFELMVEGQTHYIDPLAEVAHDSNNIDTVFEQQAASMTYWSIVHSKMAAIVQRKKREIDRTKARVANSVRSQRIPVPGNKITEAVIASVVATTPAVNRAEDEYDSAVELMDKVKGVLEGIRQRKDMITVEGYIRNSVAKF